MHILDLNDHFWLYHSLLLELNVHIWRSYHTLWTSMSIIELEKFLAVRQGGAQRPQWDGYGDDDRVQRTLAIWRVSYFIVPRQPGTKYPGRESLTSTNSQAVRLQETSCVCGLSVRQTFLNS